jgi:hypothetical protein
MSSSAVLAPCCYIPVFTPRMITLLTMLSMWAPFPFIPLLLSLVAHIHMLAKQIHRRRRYHTSSPSVLHRLAQRARRRRDSTVPSAASMVPSPPSPPSSISHLSAPLHPHRQSLKPVACRSLALWTPLSPSLRHSLMAFNVVCRSCGALHWVEERARDSSVNDPRFSACCESGTVSLPPLFDPPEPLYSLLSSTTSGTSSMSTRLLYQQLT